MTNPQNLEPRVERLETDMQDLKQLVAETSRNVSVLKSTVATLADIVQANREEAEADHAAIKERLDRAERQADADRALMLELIQSIVQGDIGASRDKCSSPLYQTFQAEHIISNSGTKK